MSQQLAVIDPQPGDLSPANAFAAWLLHGRAGDVCAYHEGFLAVDRDPLVSTLSIPTREALTAVADLALAFAEALLLVQQRLGNGAFRYLAVLASRRKTEPARQLFQPIMLAPQVRSDSMLPAVAEDLA